MTGAAVRCERLFLTLPRTPYAMLEKGLGSFPCSKQAALRMPYLQPNHANLVNWLVVDIDRRVLEPWQEAGVPEPNLVVFNPDNDHSHLFYAIDGVCTGGSGRLKPIEYLAAIQRALTLALGGDLSYTGFLCKNPFHPRWQSFELHTGVYPLCKLEGRLDLSYRNWNQQQALAADHYALGRNCALFHRLRYWSYREVWPYRDQGSLPLWQGVILNQALALNDFEQPLGYGEVRSTARSVAKWTWSRYQGRGSKRKGIMAHQLQERNIVDQKEKEQAGAAFTAQLKREQTEERILAAIEELLRLGKKVSKAEVSRRTGLHRKTLERYYAHLFLEG